jgi:hypothetical protein
MPSKVTAVPASEFYEKRNSSAVRYAWVLSAAALVSVLTIAALRIFYNLSFRQPLQLLTSGCEEESLFAIWKWIHGQAVYANPEHIPFAASYFNWLFYMTYGAITKGVLMGAGLQDDWISQVGKWISLCGAVVLGVAVFRLLRLLRKDDDMNLRRIGRWLPLGIALYVAFSPHAGFWIITTRPDVWALALEVLALGSYVRSLRSGGRGDLAWFILFAYAAWAFKQVNVTVAAACILHSVLRRKFRLAAILGAALGASFVLTLVLAGGTCRYMLLKSQMNMGFHVRLGATNLASALAKSTLAWIPWAVGLAEIVRRLVAGRASAENSPLPVLYLSALTALIFYLPLACKDGAADNYFLPFSVLAMIAWAGTFLTNPTRVLAVTVSIGALLCVTLCLLVLAGKRGRLNCCEDHQRLMIIKPYLARLPKPTLAWSGSASLPWINPNDENHFVLGCAYWTIPRARLEGGGVEGLIASGRFAVVVDPNDAHREFCVKHLRKADVPGCPVPVYFWTSGPHRATP